MSSPLIIIFSLLGFLSIMALLAIVIMFFYVIRELQKILRWLRDFTRTYLGVDIPDQTEEQRSKPGGFVKWERSWDDEKEGRN